VLDEANTRILARYGAGLGWLTGQPAVTVHSYGAGKVYLVGAHLDAAGQDELCALLVRDAQLEPVLATPAGVEACLRVTPDGRRVCILINQSGQPQHVPLDGLYHNHLTGDSAAEIWLAVYAAAVLTPHTPEEVAAQSPLTL
jgi:beta-galactosidase